MWELVLGYMGPVGSSSSRNAWRVEIVVKRGLQLHVDLSTSQLVQACWVARTPERVRVHVETWVGSLRPPSPKHAPK